MGIGSLVGEESLSPLQNLLQLWWCTALVFTHPHLQSSDKKGNYKVRSRGA